MSDRKRERLAEQAQPGPRAAAFRARMRERYQEPPTAIEVRVARMRGWQRTYTPPRSHVDPESGWRVVDRDGTVLAGPWPDNTDAWRWIRHQLDATPP